MQHTNTAHFSKVSSISETVVLRRRSGCRGSFKACPGRDTGKREVSRTVGFPYHHTFFAPVSVQVFREGLQFQCERKHKKNHRRDKGAPAELAAMGKTAPVIHA